MHHPSRRLALGAGVTAALAVACLGAAAVPASAAPLPATGPSTLTGPYLVPLQPQVSLRSLLTVGDATADGHVFTGIPDGLGISGDGRRATVYVNHELGSSAGIVRAHGEKGSYVDRLTVDTRTGEVTKGQDLIDAGVQYWDYAGAAYAAAPVAPVGAAAGTHAAAFNRFCSGHLTEEGALQWRKGNGYAGQLWFANEEGGDESRVFGVTASGRAYQLPRLGLFSWENTVNAPVRSQRTVVMGNEDGGSGQLRVYVGQKQNTGSPVERAGLTNGSLFTVDVADEAVSTDAQFRTTYGKGVPAAVTIGTDEVLDWTKNGAAQNVEAAAKGLSLNRIEDGAFDPSNPDDYYFITTSGGVTTPNPAEPSIARNGGGLWKLSFVDVTRPELGADLTLLLDGSEAPYLSAPDNLTIDERGHVLIQEDPGGSDHVARVVAYRIADGALAPLATFQPALFGVTNPAGVTPAERAILTTDEESSGIVDASESFGRGAFLLDAQVHTTKGLPTGTGPGTVEELVEGGQLLLMKVDSWRGVFSDER